MNCSKILENVSLYIDDELSKAEREEFEEHLKQCSKCRSEFNKILSTVNMCKSLTQVDPPKDFHETLLKKITIKNYNKRFSFIQKAPWRVIAGMAAVFIIAFMLGTSIDSFFDSFKTGSAPMEESKSEMSRGSAEYSMSGIPEAKTKMFSVEMQEDESLQESESLPPQKMLKEQQRAPEEPVEIQQKIIKRANMEIVVEEFDKIYNEIIHVTEQAGGFIENSGVWKTGPINSQIRRGRFTLRVPENRFTQIIETIEALGEVTTKELSGSNITKEYYDTETRVRNLERQEQRLLEILNKAKTIDEILRVENELNRVRYQIENLTGQLKNWDNLVSYSTLQIQIREITASKKQIKTTGFSGIWDKAVQGFISTINKIIGFLSTVLVFLITYSPVFIIIIIGLIAIRKGVKRYYEK